MNYFAILLCGIAYMVIGMAWYSPMLFGKAWMKEIGMSKEKADKMKSGGMMATYFMSFVSSLIMASVLSYFISGMGAATVSGGLMVAFLAWLGFAATVGLTGVFFKEESYKLFAINSGNMLVSLLVMSVILTSL